ncbi:hypothetical protein Bca4012_031728 [Brassica carinata]|uniref:Uncharacterized protein n=1 Tax=Brassica carinata TaxID=52824 RepID=A0A8X7RFJ1_BRACI|nr:hypothetical protein Bca52824_046567 [Brassica carinata]
MVDDDGSGSDQYGRADHGEDEATWTNITWFWRLRINTSFVPPRRSLRHNNEAENELDRGVDYALRCSKSTIEIRGCR